MFIKKLRTRPGKFGFIYLAHCCRDHTQGRTVLVMSTCRAEYTL